MFGLQVGILQKINIWVSTQKKLKKTEFLRRKWYKARVWTGFRRKKYKHIQNLFKVKVRKDEKLRFSPYLRMSLSRPIFQYISLSVPINFEKMKQILRLTDDNKQMIINRY